MLRTNPLRNLPPSPHRFGRMHKAKWMSINHPWLPTRTCTRFRLWRLNNIGVLYLVRLRAVDRVYEWPRNSFYTIGNHAVNTGIAKLSDVLVHFSREKLLSYFKRRCLFFPMTNHSGMSCDNNFQCELLVIPGYPRSWIKTNLTVSSPVSCRRSFSVALCPSVRKFHLYQSYASSFMLIGPLSIIDFFIAKTEGGRPAHRGSKSTHRFLVPSKYYIT